MDPTKNLRNDMNMMQCIMNVQWTAGDMLVLMNIVQWTAGDTIPGS